MSVRRVLMVNKFLYPRGGAEVYMLDLARMLAERGVETSFYAMRDPRNRDVDTSAYFPSPVDFEAPAGLRGRARAGGRMLYSMSARRGMSRLLADRTVDVAHLHNIYHQLSPSVLAPLRTAGVPVVMTVHDYKLVCPVYTLQSNGRLCERCVGGHYHHVVARRCNRGSLSGSTMVGFESWLHRALRSYLDGVDVFVAPSRYLARKLVAGGYSATRIVVIPNVVECAGVLTDPGDSVLYAGRLSHEKGVDVLIDSLAGSRLELRIAGDGPQRGALERLARDRGVPAVFLGHLAPDRLAAELEAARVVAVPSTWPENCPLIVLEAMAAGRPVVATGVGGLPELVADGETGLLVRPGDPTSLAGALTRLTADRNLARDLGAAGRRRALLRHSQDAHLAAVLAAYDQAAARVEQRAA